MIPKPITDEALIEALAELEHDQWMHWSKVAAPGVSEATRAGWQASWIPYAELTDELKEADRIWARKTVALLRERRLIY